MTQVANTADSASAGDSSLDSAMELGLQAEFATFYAREIRSVIGLAYVLSGSRSGAEDLAQDALLAAYRNWDRIYSYDNAAAWVRRVLVNRAISTARTRAAETRALLRLRGQRIVVPELSPESEQLWESVRRLPRRQAQVIALHYWDTLTVAEIAHVLELSQATVKTHLQRGRQALADLHEKD